VDEAVLIPFGEGEIVGDSADRRVEILSDDETLNATWSRLGPLREGADLHVHRSHTDLFYILAGELTLRLGGEDEQVAVPAGTLAHVPPLVVHGFRNGGDAELRYLNFHVPGERFTDYLRAMRDGRPFSFDQHPPPERGVRPSGDAVVGGAELVSDRRGMRVELLADLEELGISESRVCSDRLSPPAHVHAEHSESFYVLEGQMTFTVGERELEAEAGTWVQVPPGTPHTFALTGDGDVRFLDLHTPSCGYGTFLRGLHDARTDAELAAVRAAFDQKPA
jgi:mannose-6-phosphate isomerase-like protein (cupin superfamily)